ncbi:MAG: bacteriohemerythrin [Treponema sp.]|jgi:hemerythrin|nr:bacteriohemerythrin [Treponema sp.]
MAYTWDSSLETGHEKIDNQHKQLISALNNLIEASSEGKGEEEIFRTLDFLTGYTIKHFGDEEKLQTMYDYPDYHVHKRIHDEFKNTVGTLTKRLRDEGPNKALVGEVTDAVGAWLLNHIKGDDFRMAAFVKTKEEDAAV